VKLVHVNGFEFHHQNAFPFLLDFLKVFQNELGNVPSLFLAEPLADYPLVIGEAILAHPLKKINF